MITLKELRQHVKLEADLEDDMPLVLQSIIDEFESLSGRLWAYRDGYVDYQTVYPLNVKCLWAPLFPLTSIAIREWSDFEVEADVEDTDPTEYQASLQTGRITRYKTSWFKQNVRMTLSGGYTPDTAPADVKLAIIQQVKFTIRRFDSQTIQLKTRSINRNVATFIDDAVCPAMQAVITRVRRDVV